MATAIQSTGCAPAAVAGEAPPCEYQVETEEHDQQQEHVGAERRQWDRSQENHRHADGVHPTGADMNHLALGRHQRHESRQQRDGASRDVYDEEDQGKHHCSTTVLAARYASSSAFNSSRRLDSRNEALKELRAMRARVASSKPMWSCMAW